MIAKAENTPLERVRVLQRKLYLAAKGDPRRKFGVLYDKVCQYETLSVAYQQVRSNKGAPGIDHKTFDVIEDEYGLDRFLGELQGKLVQKRYRPLPVRRVYIPKADGSQRPLGIPTIADRVVQAAVKIVIEPLFEASFKDFSYGFRPRQSAQQALREVYKWLNFKCRWVVDADLKSYFDTIPHDKLLLSVRTKVIDRSIVKLIAMWLKAGVMDEMQVKTDVTGTPQGGVISPLLANLYLHWLDSVWESKGFGKRPHDAHIVRYADDFVILCRDNPEKYLGEAKKVLDRLGLTLNAQKTRIVDATRESFDFLGHRFAVQPSKRTGKLKTYYYPTPKAMKAVKKKIRETVRHGQHWDLPVFIREKVNPILRGWGNYFKTANSRKHFLSIANYTTWTLTIMLRKKHKKRSKGWRDHPPSWFYEYQGLFKLYSLSVTGEAGSRYLRSS
ncbi:group II intron reverse transcriptase/maturase [Acidithiobacillus caldus]|uniref:Group II intron reverse transcriptase/maturase n=2 Tax=Acidithiobacillus caldus TaxID=33059 RepID=A0A1E7YN93_9PROT|nr:group II intron reverse transcriptase/maturase [Acidithiobacillus caldus]OFC35541.1 group II intron reverse transcriptase/maturase [Acidithiobacillus caldus]OFC36390.1 group II intron reverse transcriptase/maturase [Acidithiobacillus caldus]OFC40456.1 group II intron reverse transcriptase/maturase [Acidithiobacillus caldus]